MDFFQSLSGSVSLELTAADPAAALCDLRNAGITVLFARVAESDITVHMSIRRKDYPALKKLAKHKGYGLHLTRKTGYYWHLKSLMHRPVLLVGIVLLFFLTLFVPSRILFLKVEGNKLVSTRQIIEKCQEFGITFGCSRRQIRSEKLKNALLEQIPQLEWAGVNTAGCVATVTVSERPQSQEPPAGITAINSIVAIRDGIITECTVTRGKALCRVGQAVKAGQMLISGYTDCGISIRAEGAKGEVFGQTERDFSGIVDRNRLSKVKTGQTIRKYAVIIGKNRINFYKDSGIPASECDRIYTQIPLTLPGGLELPVWLVIETWICYEPVAQVISEDTARQILLDYASAYTKEQMVAGQIMSRIDYFTENSDAFRLEGKYYCHEMIGQIKHEEIIPPYGKYD